MKTFIVSILVILVSLPAMAQKGLFDQLTEKYSDTAGFSASQITSDMFDLYIRKKNIEEDSPLHEALNDLERIVVISQSNFSGSLAGDNKKDENSVATGIYQTMLDHYKTNNFVLFKTENRMGEDLKVYLKKDDDNIRSLALVTHSPVSVNLIELQGDIDLSTVSEISKAMNLRGLENLYRINSSGAPMAPSFYGHRPYMSEEEIEQMLSKYHKEIEKQHQLTKEQREEIEKKAREMADKQREMAEKHRELAAKYQRQPIILSAPGDTNTVYYIDGRKVKAEDIKKLSPESIERIEVTKSDKPNEKSSIRIKTK